MDSLPEQHIEKLPTATRDDAYSKIGKVFLLRRDGSEPEDEVAHRAGFGSAAAMHHQLRVWGLAGLLPPEDEEQPQKARAPKGGGERMGRGGGKGGGGKAQELPAAADAGGLFRSAIDRLKSDLHYTNHLVEVLEGPIFEAAFVYPKEEDPHPLVYLREQVPERLSAERWEELCAEQGKDPASTDELYVYQDSRYLGGTSPWPTMHLVRLIAAYCICAKSPEDIEALLDRLHPKSRKPNVAQINKYLTGNEGLLVMMKKLAQVVRGKTVPRGLNAVGEDFFHHTAGDFIRTSREQGVQEKEIVRELREEFKLPEDEILRLTDVFQLRLVD